MDWLIKTFAFTERVRDKRSDGTVRHAELLLDSGGVIMLGSAGPASAAPASSVRSPRCNASRSPTCPPTATGPKPPAPTVSEISIRANQARSYTVDDPEGHRWYFSEPLS